jgi:hypothetical protein
MEMTTDLQSSLNDDAPNYSEDTSPPRSSGCPRCTFYVGRGADGFDYWTEPTKDPEFIREWRDNILPYPELADALYPAVLAKHHREDKEVA